VLVFVLGAVDFAAELGTDYGAYFSHGWFITCGLIPYGDFWTHKTPLLPVMIAVWVKLFGTGFLVAAVFPLVVSCIATLVVYKFARALELSKTVAVGAALLFAFVVGSHPVDPTRNGIIVIAAAVCEMLAIILAIRGIDAERRTYLAATGIMIALGFATRQTAAIVCIPVAIVIAMRRGRQQVARSVLDVGLVAVTAGISAGAMALYFVVNRVPLATVWHQIYGFNVVYSAGHRMKLTWWLSEWSQLLWHRGMAIFVVGVLWFAWKQAQALRRRKPLDAALVLSILLVVHLAAVFLSRKVQAMYLFQLLPELCVITALVWQQASRAEGTIGSAARRRWSVMALGVLLLAWPLTLEANHWAAVLGRARASGYLLHVHNLPSQVLARRIQSLTQESDRIWVFAANADPLYPFANRLPAIRMTSVAGLVYPRSGDFEEWRADFNAHKPRVVVSFYGEDFLRRYADNPRASNGQSMSTIVQIKQYLSATMRRVDTGAPLPEFLVWVIRFHDIDHLPCKIDGRRS
jgi:hypothetical protein